MDVFLFYEYRIAMNISEFKVWARSKSRRFAHDNRYDKCDNENPIGSVVWSQGDGEAIYYRRGMAQAPLVNSILFRPGKKAEYWLPEQISPRVILDIGANIGATTRYLAHRFPMAKIYSFEPISDNFHMLKMNAPESAQIFSFGLGSESKQVAFRAPTGWGNNSGGYSQYNVGSGNDHQVAEIRNIADVLNELSIFKVDLIKIDTEGAEYDILNAIPSEILSRVNWIYGELHGEDIIKPTDFKLLDMLSEWFDISVNKRLRQRNYFFDACNRARSETFRRFIRAI